MTIANLRGRATAFAAMLASSFALSACTDWAGHDLDQASGVIPQLANMRSSVIPDPYAMPRLPAANSVPSEHPLGDIPAEYSQTQLDSAAATLRNPLPRDAETLRRGQLQYERNCSVCHGSLGDGKGPAVGPGKFPFAPAVNSGPTQGRSDGYIYAVIDVGRGLMPPYGERMTHLDRWAVVSYVRHLQGIGEVASPPPAVSGVPLSPTQDPTGSGNPSNANAAPTSVREPGPADPQQTPR